MIAVLFILLVWACVCVIWFNTKDFYQGDRWWDFPMNVTCFIVMIIWYFFADLFSKWSNENDRTK